MASNTFNFIVLVVLLLIIFQKLNLTDKLGELKENTINKIKNSEKTKSDAEANLSDAKSKVTNLDNEIEEKLKIAGIRADNVADMIEKTTRKKLNQINANTKRVIENEGKTLISILSDKTAGNSIETAEKYIRNRLKADPTLHEKYINESIENLEKVLL